MKKYKQNIHLFLWLLLGAIGLYSTYSYLVEQRDYRVYDEMSDVRWVAVANTELPDITAMAFDERGLYGAAVSNDGMLIATEDGGKSWRSAGSAPLEDGEMVTAICVLNTGEIAVSAGVDESNWTAIYHRKPDGSWEQITAQLGGIGGASIDGKIFIGGSGLMAHRQTMDWTFSKLPDSSVMLYGVAQYDNSIIAAGDKGRVYSSKDNGNTWTNFVIDSNHKARPLYAVAISNRLSLVAGSQGSLWLQVAGNENSDTWKEIVGLTDQQSIFALHLSSQEREVFAAGGSDAGDSPFIISSFDGGKRWYFESIGIKSKGRIVAIAQGNSGWFAATMGGRILKRNQHTTLN